MIFQKFIQFSTILTLTLVTRGVTGSVYNRTNVSLSEFPHDIPADVNVIDVSYNQLSFIDFLEPFLNLVNISFKYNYLTEFPNLENVSFTLLVLNLESNLITTIGADYLDALTSLQILQIGYNPLTTIPDVSGPSNTLFHIGVQYTSLTELPDLRLLGRTIWSVYAYGNPGITEITLAQLERFPRLGFVYISGTGLRSLPNFCRIGGTSQLEIDVDGLVLDCDVNFLWLKLAAETGHVVFYGSAPSCSQDGGSTVIPWDNIDVNAITSSGNQALYAVLEDPGSFYCYPLVTSVMTSSGPGSCGLQCLKEDDCVMFSASNGQCTLTTLQTGNQSDWAAYSPWFVAQ